MHDAIHQLLEKLGRHGELRFVHHKRSVRIEPTNEDGFPIDLFAGSSELVVNFAGWHEHFREIEQALNCIAFGLSDACRLKVEKRGSFPFRWTVESLEHGHWIAGSETGLLLYPFWLRTTVEYLQNRHIISSPAKL